MSADSGFSPSQCVVEAYVSVFQQQLQQQQQQQ